jgi:hypothetical protein
MSSQLVPVITNDGREALISGFSTPNNYRFSQVALGDANKKGYDPDPAANSLINEMQRVDISSVIVQDKARLHITAVVGMPGDSEPSNSVDEYEIREIGFYLQKLTDEGKNEGDPLLFAIYSSTAEKPLLSKERDTELLLAFDLVLPDAVEGDMSFDDKSYLHLPMASEDAAGLLRIATESEVLAGENTGTAITPAALKTALKQVQADTEAKQDKTDTQSQSGKIDENIELKKNTEIFFADNGQVRSHDNNHRLLFRRSENIMELREWGKIVFSPGAKKGQATAKMTLEENGALEVLGEIDAGNSDIYFTNTNHDHTGKGNAEGHAAIENAKNYHALMILGRSIKGKGRRVKLWDHLQVNGNMQVTGVIEQEAWHDAKLLNGWTRYSNTYNPPQFFKDSMGVVHFRGLIKRPGWKDFGYSNDKSRELFKLPNGYHPQFRELLVCARHPETTIGRIDVLPDGTVKVMAGSGGWTSLDGISFRTA